MSGYNDENCTVGPHKRVNSGVTDWRFSVHKEATPGYWSQSPGMTSAAFKDVRVGAESSQSDMEDELPAPIKTWYDGESSDVQDACYECGLRGPVVSAAAELHR